MFGFRLFFAVRPSRSLAFAATLAAAFAVLSPAVWAAPVSAGRAIGVARSHGPRRAPTGITRTCSQDGTNLFHIVSLEGGGFVTVAADDSMPPVLGFSPSGEMPDADEGNPFWALVGGEAQLALELAREPGAGTGAARRAAGSPPGRRRGAGRGRMRLKDERHAMPLAAASPAPVKSDAALDDMRVAPLVKTKWAQDYVGGLKVYNYYTPSNYCCGCVATALAQVMRYHAYPASAPACTFTCYVGPDLTKTRMTMKGGVYGWETMPDNPVGYSSQDPWREAVGRICYDAGVAMRMHYGFSGRESGAFTGFAFDPLVNVFGYASAKSWIDVDGIQKDDLNRIILPNFDAKCPVLLGIERTLDGAHSNGHAIVADGYGYQDGTLYCHLNMGWAGSSDYWYALPEIGTGYGFNTVTSVVYDIFPTRTGELATGRVLLPDGRPAAGAAVSAKIVYESGRYFRRTTTVYASSTADENGIYAIFAPTGVTSEVTLSARHGWRYSSRAVITSTASGNSPKTCDFDSGEYDYGSTGTFWKPVEIQPACGSSWGNDIVVDRLDDTCFGVFLR